MAEIGTVPGSRDGRREASRPLRGETRSRAGKLALALVIAAALAGCAYGESGDVDHSCHTNPLDSQGSGCEHHQLP